MSTFVINDWSRAFRARFGGELPREYCAIDTETTGRSPNDDVVWQVGHVLVRDGEVVDRAAWTLDWTRSDRVQRAWLSNRVVETASSMLRSGRATRLSWAEMAKGKPPGQVLGFYRRFVSALRERGVPFVLPGFPFDERMLDSTFRRCGGEGFAFGPDEVFDTASVEKADQMAGHPARLPRPGDTLRSYFQRVSYARVAGVRYKLDSDCVARHGLAASHGVDGSRAHDAEYDAWLTHLVFERHREMTHPADAFADPVAFAAGVTAQLEDVRRANDPDEAVKDPDWFPTAAPPPAAERAPLRRRRGQRNC